MKRKRKMLLCVTATSLVAAVGGCHGGEYSHPVGIVASPLDHYPALDADVSDVDAPDVVPAPASGPPPAVAQGDAAAPVSQPARRDAGALRPTVPVPVVGTTANLPDFEPVVGTTAQARPDIAPKVGKVAAPPDAGK